ncbi:MAG: hypothetical protein A2Z57_12030 [Planctomycetes bacterium RIFCSPHIGHO2_12_39_6]|nr:MAG: hypothetical protein A2Z57_12030 [Planctomycetes bacterium RIFCSPHIGHO2_12_39_6]
MNTELKIYQTSGTVFMTSGTIDLHDDIPISLNYSIADIKEPQKRNSDYSKTVTVPGTNNNNKLFAHIYEIGVDRLYNPNHKVEARVFYGNQVFKGFMRLAKIKTLKNQKIEYYLELKGRLDDLFTTLVDKRLTDLTWTDLNHVYNRANQIASWSTPVGSNYVYPFIDYGYSINKIDYDVNHFFPAVYIKEVWDRIFSYAGFQYSSSFLTGTFFKSLIMPFVSDKMRLSNAQITARNFRASRLTTDQTDTVTALWANAWDYDTVIFNNDSTAPSEDGGGNYNTGTGIYTVPANGYYNFVTSIALYGSATPNVANQNVNKNIYCYPRFVVNNVATTYGTPPVMNLSTGCSTLVSTPQTSPTYTQQVSWSGFLQAGDTVYVQLQSQLFSTCTSAIDDVTYAVNVDTGSYFYAKVDPELKDGDTVTFSNTLPQEMKATEFLMWIMKMFNLYFEYDKDTPNKIHIAPRNDFYNTTVQDWSEKQDVEKEPEIIPMGALNAKRYRFTYKKDGDVLNKTYENTYGEVYGERYKDVDNDFLKNTETMEIGFSPTPSYSSTASDRIYPAILNVDSSMQVVHNKSMNPRILYYGGLKTCQAWNFISKTAGTSQTQYPYCGHLDDPTTPTIDLNFGVPYEVYYIPPWQGAYTNNNIYNVYWRQFIEEITDYNSSIVTAWFWLTPVDILEVDFRHIYRFMNQNFRLNKIYDYNPSALSLTKCEFIKVKAGVPFVPQNKYIIGANDDTFNSTL